MPKLGKMGEPMLLHFFFCGCTNLRYRPFNKRDRRFGRRVFHVGEGRRQPVSPCEGADSFARTYCRLQGVRNASSSAVDVRGPIVVRACL
jgi:hypothetical protein